MLRVAISVETAATLSVNKRDYFLLLKIKKLCLLSVLFSRFFLSELQEKASLLTILCEC